MRSEPPQPGEWIEEVSLDGGKVRLRSESVGQPSYWRDYKAARLNSKFFGAFFQANLTLTDWINAQPLSVPLVYLGDSHDGIWNLFAQIASAEQRRELLDWYHLKENLFKVGGSIKRLRQAEALLWQGEVEAVITLFANCRRKSAATFCAYLEHHRHRIINYAFINYAYCQTMLLCPISIGSGAVESAIKQLDRRLKLSGAQWKPSHVNQMLALRCAYLNGMLDAA